MDKGKGRAILASIGAALRPIIIEQTKRIVVEKALKAFLQSGAGAGVQAWLVKTMATTLFNELGEPLIKAAFVEMGYRYDRVSGKILVKRLSDARGDGDVEGYNSAADGIMSKQLSFNGKKNNLRSNRKSPNKARKVV